MCHRCGDELEDEAIEKFNQLKTEWKTVLPACSGKCSNAPKLGWVTSGVTKKGVTAAGSLKRKHVDLRSFVPRPIEGSFGDWLADSKLVWDQLRFELRTRRQIKRRRKNASEMN